MTIRCLNERDTRVRALSGRFEKGPPNLVTQHSAQLGLDGFFERERIQSAIKIFQGCNLLFASDSAGFEALKGRGGRIVNAPLAAAFHLGTQMLHHRAKEVAKPPPFLGVELVEQLGGSRILQPYLAPQLTHVGPVLLLDARRVVFSVSPRAWGA